MCTPCPDSHGCWEFLRVIAPMGPKDNIAQFSPSAGSYIPSSIFSSISSMSPKTWSQGIDLDIIPHLQLSTESLFFTAFWPVVYFSIDYCPLQKDQGLKQPRSIIEVSIFRKKFDSMALGYRTFKVISFCIDLQFQI